MGMASRVGRDIRELTVPTTMAVPVTIPAVQTMAPSEARYTKATSHAEICPTRKPSFLHSSLTSTSEIGRIRTSLEGAHSCFSVAAYVLSLSPLC